MQGSSAGFASTSTGSSPLSAGSNSGSFWDSYPLAHARRPIAPLPSTTHLAQLGRRPSMLASQVVSAQTMEEDVEFSMNEIQDDPVEMDMLDNESLRPLSSRPSTSRHSYSSSASSQLNFGRQPSSPTMGTFNPLNPQALGAAPRPHRESSGESVTMQADTPSFRSPTPPAMRPDLPHRAKPSPSLLFQPFGGSTPTVPETPPQQERRRFSSVDPAGERPAPTASPGAVQGLSTSPSSRAGPAKRIVTGKRQNLMPRSKAHLRVQMQLQDEGSAPFDVEVASEAALHRLARSAASALSPRGIPPTPNTLANRYPESIDGDDEHGIRDGSTSSEEDAVSDMASRGDDIGSVTDEPLGPMALAEQEERRRQANLWGGFREKSLGQSPTALTSGRGMDIDTFSPTGSSSGWPSMSMRSNKRKMADNDRFEPYSSMAFKRRAVSPTASSVHGSSTPALGSPILGAFSAATLTTPIQIPPMPLSPGSTGLGLFPSQRPGSSRASSPAASVTGPLSTSATRGPISAVLSARNTTDAALMNARDDDELSEALTGGFGMNLG